MRKLNFWGRIFCRKSSSSGYASRLRRTGPRMWSYRGGDGGGEGWRRACRLGLGLRLLMDFGGLGTSLSFLFRAHARTLFWITRALDARACFSARRASHADTKRCIARAHSFLWRRALSKCLQKRCSFNAAALFLLALRSLQRSCSVRAAALNFRRYLRTSAFLVSSKVLALRFFLPRYFLVHTCKHRAARCLAKHSTRINLFFRSCSFCLSVLS